MLQNQHAPLEPKLNLQLHIYYSQGLVQSVELIPSLMGGLQWSFFSSQTDKKLELCIEEWFQAYLQKKHPTRLIPFNWSFLPVFTQQVLQAIMKIPFGTVRTYGEIASVVHNPQGARAVGGACRRNPFPFFVPCHRVLDAKHTLRGYSAGGGMPIKESLLLFEGVGMS